jgi:NADH:ubiquinone oxidoreductase subunit F (NADH-binding)
VKEAFTTEVQALGRALGEMGDADALGGVPAALVLGPDRYLLGEETGMEEVIEGRPPLPQVARPFIQGCSPAPEDNPTLVNNVETLANVAPILADGPDWLRATGTQLAPEQLDVPLDFDSMRQVGSGLGAAGFAVLDDPAWMVQAAWRSSRFLFVESCGQCPACKFGTGEVTQTLAAIQAGGGSDRDLERILVRARGSTSGQKCALPTGESLLMQSLVQGSARSSAATSGGRVRCPASSPSTSSSTGTRPRDSSPTTRPTTRSNPTGPHSSPPSLHAGARDLLERAAPRRCCA